MAEKDHWSPKMGTPRFKIQSPRCAELRRVDAYLDGRLPRGEAEAFSAHLRSCDTCCREVGSLRSVVGCLSQLPSLNPSPAFRAKLRVRLEQTRRSPVVVWAAGGRCRELRLVDAYLDGRLPYEQERAFAAHLDECALCRREVESLRSAVGWLSRSPGLKVSPRFRANLRARLEETHRSRVPAWARWATVPVAVLLIWVVVKAGLGPAERPPGENQPRPVVLVPPVAPFRTPSPVSGEVAVVPPSQPEPAREAASRSPQAPSFFASMGPVGQGSGLPPQRPIRVRPAPGMFVMRLVPPPQPDPVFAPPSRMAAHRAFTGVTFRDVATDRPEILLAPGRETGTGPLRASFGERSPAGGSEAHGRRTRPGGEGRPVIVLSSDGPGVNL